MTHPDDATVVRICAERDGWTEIRCCEGGNVLLGEPDDDWNRDVDEHAKHGTCGFPTHKHREPLPDFLHSTDAIRPVLLKLTPEEKQRLAGTLLSAYLQSGQRYQLIFALELPPDQLARAVAEAIQLDKRIKALEKQKGPNP